MTDCTDPPPPPPPPPPTVESQQLVSERTLEAQIHKISQEIDFKPYLDAVNAGSTRTRSTLYVLVAILVLLITSYRNTSSPDWLDARLERFQLASACINEKKRELKNAAPAPTSSLNTTQTIETECPIQNQIYSAECTEAIKYSKGFLFSGSTNQLLLQSEFCNELGDQIVALIRERTQALSVRLPFFGLAIDANDLGLISGVFLVFVLYILRAGLDREVDNLDRAMKKAKEVTDVGRRKENLELLLMTQVLAAGKGPTIAPHLIFILIIGALGYVVWDDYSTLGVAHALQGPFWARVETAADILVFFGVVSLCLECWLQQRALDRKVDCVLAELNPTASKGNCGDGTASSHA